MLTYEPLVEGLERNLPREHLLESHFHPPGPHPANTETDKLEILLTRFHAEAATIFAIDRIVTSRVGDLFVLEMSVPFEIRENEGQERVVDVSRRREVVVSLVTVAAETGKSSTGINGVGGSSGGGCASGGTSASASASAAGEIASPPPSATPPPTPVQSVHQQPSQQQQPVTRGVTAALAAARGIASPLLPATSGKPSQQTTQPEQPVSRGLPPTTPPREPPRTGAKKWFERG
ncbi:hypothetical protein LTR12_005737 [Friedmanniomyces endolithicus]|nr:hypothetical protein LTR12_005737 [Friedmanniomyces endolithicus]